MKKLFGLLLLVVVSSSCMTVNRIQKNCDVFAAVCGVETITETITEYKDTVIYVDVPVVVELPKDTVIIIKEIPCPEEINIAPIVKEEGLVGVRAEVKKSVLNVKGYLTDSLYVTRLQDSIKILNAIKQETVTETQTVVVKEDTSFGKFAKRWFFGTILLLLLIIGYKIYGT